MKNEIVDLMTQLGIAWKFVVNGVLGATVWAVKKKAKFVEALRQIFIGGIVAGFATPIIAEKSSMTYAGFLSFTIGIIGISVIDTLVEWIGKKALVIKDFLKNLFS